MKLRVALFLTVVCLSVILFSCRRNQPSLVDTNRPPDTELWYAPLDSTEYEWNVHMYWRGVDMDGIAQRYMWTITDTLEANPALRWNPAERVVDLRRGRLTERTDSVIAFTAYTNVAGVGLRKNRQAFHIAAIDDNGVIDPTPAVIEFVATVSRLPQMRFMLTITKVEHEGGDSKSTTKLYNPAVLDTVGMFRPINISYRGSTTNGVVLGYKFFPLTAEVAVPGQDIWTEDLADTTRYFPNVGEDALPSPIFRFVAQCRDGSGAESRADTKSFSEGVVQVVVNYVPDTEIYQVENTYFIGGQEFNEFVNFQDGTPDTVPYSSWLRVDCRGWDNPKDSSLCTDDLNKCISYRFSFLRRSSRVPGSKGGSGGSVGGWLPSEGADNNPNGTADSTTLNIGSFEYKIRASAVDEYAKADTMMFEPDPVTGGPDWSRPKSQIEIVGNYDPTLDDAHILNYDGVIAPTDRDTIVWDWWNPSNYTGNPEDTTEYDLQTEKTYAKKTFYFEINAAGHDHWKENSRFGVRAWEYSFIRMDTRETEPSFEGQDAWLSGTLPNVFSKRFSVTYRYDIAADPGGRSFWGNPPAFWNTEYRFSIQGRDIPQSTNFEEYMFVQGEKKLLNSTPHGPCGRWTETKQLRFFLKVAR